MSIYRLITEKLEYLLDKFPTLNKLRSSRKSVGAQVALLNRPWQYKLDVADLFHSDGLPFNQKRDRIVKRIRAARWYTADDFELVGIVDELSEATNEDEFDSIWSYFYDYADANRIWIETI